MAHPGNEPFFPSEKVRRTHIQMAQQPLLWSLRTYLRQKYIKDYGTITQSLESGVGLWPSALLVATICSFSSEYILDLLEVPFGLSLLF